MEVVKENNKTLLNILSEKLNGFKEKLKQPRGTEMLMPIDKIYVPRRIAESSPSLEKYYKYEKYFLRHGKVDKPIEVFQDRYDSNRYILANGYIRYLILGNYDITDIPVKIIENYIKKVQ